MSKLSFCLYVIAVTFQASNSASYIVPNTIKSQTIEHLLLLLDFH